MAGLSAGKALREMISRKFLGPPTSIAACAGKGDTLPLGIFYDLDVFNQLLNDVQEAFGEGFFHAMAIKANPLSSMMNIINKKGLGAECASIGEVCHSLILGFHPSKVVFDSPVKTAPEIEFALEKGIHINIDNPQELEVVAKLKEKYSDSESVIGLRINPLIGEGDVKILSVATPDSKFGCLLSSETKEEVIQRFVKYPWLTCIHVHTGSQCLGLEQMCRGVRIAVDLALEVNRTVGRNQVDTMDIGGGLTANIDGETHTPSFKDYADELKKWNPELFPSAGIFKRVITEFGQSLSTKAGWIASVVEYTKTTSSGLNIALLHAGADLFVRTCYCPSQKKYQKRVNVFDKDGNPKSGKELRYNLAGPLCFAGDVLKRNVALPEVEPGDYIVFLDCGGNSLSLYSRHCSRFAPRVYGYKINQETGQFDVDILKEAETMESMLNFWGFNDLNKKLITNHKC